MATFYPDPTNSPMPDYIFNMFNGFYLKTLIDEDNSINGKGFKYDENIFINSPLYELVNEVICAGDDKLIEYTNDYIAHMFQNPCQKPGTGMLLYGLGGEGKDRFSTFLGNLLGLDYFIKYNNLGVINKQFNSMNRNKILVVLNEVDDKSSFKNHGSLNDLFTRESENIEPKGIDPDNCPCYKRVIINTNYRDTLYMDNAMRRRVTLYEVSDKRVGDFEYFNEVSMLIEDKEFLKQAYTYYTTRDISKFKPRKLPETRYKYEQILLNIKSSYKFIMQLAEVDIGLHNIIYKDLYEYASDLSDKEVEKGYIIDKEHNYQFKVSDLYRIYKTWAGDQDEKLINKKIFKQDMLGLKLGDGKKHIKPACSKYIEEYGEKLTKGYIISNLFIKNSLKKMIRI